MNYRVEREVTKEILDKLYKECAFTLETCPFKTSKEIIQWIETCYAKPQEEVFKEVIEYVGVADSEKALLDELIERLKVPYAKPQEEAIVYVIPCKLMNDVYGLTDDNAYPDDLFIISVSNINSVPISVPMRKIGGRWFNDIVDNNKRHQDEINANK
jgi:hypothetical protein